MATLINELSKSLRQVDRLRELSLSLMKAKKESDEKKKTTEEEAKARETARE